MTRLMVPTYVSEKGGGGDGAMREEGSPFFPRRGRQVCCLSSSYLGKGLVDLGLRGLEAEISNVHHFGVPQRVDLCVCVCAYACACVRMEGKHLGQLVGQDLFLSLAHAPPTTYVCPRTANASPRSLPTHRKVPTMGPAWWCRGYVLSSPLPSAFSRFVLPGLGNA